MSMQASGNKGTAARRGYFLEHTARVPREQARFFSQIMSEVDGLNIEARKIGLQETQLKKPARWNSKCKRRIRKLSGLFYGPKRRQCNTPQNVNNKTATSSGRLEHIWERTVNHTSPALRHPLL